MANQVVRITGEINMDAFTLVAEALDVLSPKDTLTIEICSYGGDALAALAIYDKIKKSKAKIITIGIGQVYSAAVLVLAAGVTVYLTPNTWVMVHEDSGKEKFESIVALEREAKQYRRMEDQWCHLLMQETGTSSAKWSELHKATTYLDAQECIVLGLVDGTV